MVPYSNDPRERVLVAGDPGEGTQEEIAGRSHVPARWSRQLPARRIATGSISPEPSGGGRRRSIRGEAAEAPRAAVRDEPDATLAGLRRATGCKGCPMTIWRAIERPKITRKEKSPRPREQLDPEVIARPREWGERTSGIDPGRFTGWRSAR